MTPLILSSLFVMEAAMPFNYDREAPGAIRIQEETVLEDDAMVAKGASFDGPRGGTVTGVFVRPKSDGPHAAIFTLHFGGRQTIPGMLREASDFARSGIATLIVDAPWLRANQTAGPHASRARALFDQAGVELLRAAQLLAMVEGIDRDRIAFVGHGFGAHLGAAVAALAPEVSAAILIAGSPRMSRQMVEVAHPFWREPGIDAAILAKASRDMEELDAVRFIKRSRVPVMLQFGRGDPFVSDDEARALIDATPQPREARWYGGGHGVSDKSAVHDRIAFILEHARRS